MENLKIRVNNEAESKEAQELFFELGYGWRGLNLKNSIFIPKKLKEYFIINYENTKDMQLSGIFDNSETLKAHKEITLPELCDMVVLKRNSIDDATHENSHNQKLYKAENGWYIYIESHNAWMWNQEELGYKPIKLKPIEKPMKEYLRKNSNGTYSYIGTVRPEHVSDFMIEIPEGAEILIGLNKRIIGFYKNDFGLTWIDGEGWIETKNEYSDWIKYPVLWQRTTHPEELPFIDDEPLQSLNDQYAEIEKVRQSHRTASEIADSALKHIRERAETYDQPTGERSAAKTAKAFNAITGKDITESEVWLLLQLLKDVRQWSREDYHQDSAEDCIAYASLKAESLEGGE